MFFRKSPQKTLQRARRAIDEGACKRALQLLDGLDSLTELQTVEKDILAARALRDQGKPGEARKRLKAILKSPVFRDAEKFLEELDEAIGEKARDLEKSATRALLAKRPRFEAGEVTFRGKTLHFPDAPSLVSQYEEFFVRDSYRFEAENDAPRILDCGANAGIAILYFKQLYPRSRIVAFEPDPDVFSRLEKNVSSYALEGVEIHNLALWEEEGPRTFSADGADAGHIGEPADGGGQITVECARLSRFLVEPTEFLKMDIEGAEYEVLRECAGQLPLVRNMFIEYHSFPEVEQTLSAILAILKDAGFRVSVDTPDNIRSKPFVDRNLNGGMDLRAHVFAFR